MKVLNTLVLLLGLTALAGCPSADQPGGETEKAPVGQETKASPVSQDAEGAVATWNGGRVEIEEVERRLSDAPGRRGATEGADAAARLDALVGRYRQAARAVTVEKIVLADVPDRDAAIAALDLTERDLATRRRTVLQFHMRERREAIEIPEEQVAAYYEDKREQFKTGPSVMLFNIYRRHEDPDKPEATTELLLSLRQRFLDGETFASLAREHSHSETRLRDGQVGQYKREDMPPKLAEAVFKLEEGEISEPHPVKDGAVLLYVRDRTDGSEFGLEEVRERIEGVLSNRALNEEIAETARDLEPPDGSTLIAAEELKEILEGDDFDREVLVVGDFLVTAREMARFAAQTPAPDDIDPEDDSDEAALERLAYAYRRQLDQALLYGLIESDDTVMNADARREAEERLATNRDRMIADEKIRGRVEDLVEADSERLEAFYEDNSHHFQSPLRFRLRRLAVPIGEDPIARMAAVERMREKLIAGKIDLDGAAKELDGEIEDLDWKAFDELTDITSKARTYLLELGGLGFVIPYQDEDQIHLLQVEAREEPEVLPLEEALERVRDEYLARNERAISKQVTDEILEKVVYTFHEKTVRDYLAPPS